MALTLIKAARLIDGTGSPSLERGAMLLEDDTIREVGTEESVLPPEGADVEEIDYGDRTVLPGLIDCHVHLIGFGDGRPGDDLNTLPDEVLALQAARNARAHLYNGVTSVRDCGAKNRTTLMLRQAAEMGIMPTPRLLLSGRPVAIVGGISATSESRPRGRTSAGPPCGSSSRRGWTSSRSRPPEGAPGRRSRSGHPST